MRFIYHTKINEPAASHIIRISLLICMLLIQISLNAQAVLPDVEVKTLEGKTVNFSDQIEAGQMTVISFWATWCAPCKVELDAIAEIYEEWQEDYNMSLIAVSVDDARASAKIGPMVAEKDWPYLILNDSNQELMRKLSFQSIPYTILVNQEGEIVYTHTGYLPGDEEELEQQMQGLLE